MNSKTFCLAPFYSIVVRTNGMMSPCCNINGSVDIKNTTVDQYWNSAEMQDLRQRMLDGSDYIKACDACYTEEQVIGKSLRSGHADNLRTVPVAHMKNLVNDGIYSELAYPHKIEMHVGNLCNLKCLTCRPSDSSQFLTENRVLNISHEIQSDYQLDEQAVKRNIEIAFEKKLRVLDLRGGESMLMPAIQELLLAAPQSTCGKTNLVIQTNGTVLNDAWKIILKKFRQVTINLSIDAYDADNHYIRYPADWDKIENTVEFLKAQRNIHVSVNVTVSNLNFLVLPKILNWLKLNKLQLNISLARWPDHYQYTNMPQELFEQGCQQLAEYPEAKILLTATADPRYWESFCQIIDQRDQHRKNSIFDVLPQYKPYWNQKL